MACEITTLDFRDDAARYIAAAAYLAILAYPDASEIDKRDEFVKAVKACWVKDAKPVTGAYMYPKDLRSYSNQKIDNQIRKASRRIYTKRFAARAMALKLLMDHSSKTGLTINKLIQANYVAFDENHNQILDGDENAYQRIWEPSKPVLHLVFGLMNSFSVFGSTDVDIYALLRNPLWVESAVENSEGLRKLFQAKFKGSKFSIGESEQIQILLRI